MRLYIVMSWPTASAGSACHRKKAKESKTQWNVQERFMHATLVYASPLSGRTHQIRVHGLSIGHPLVGDEKYGHETEYRGPKPHRLCLHAMRLEIPVIRPLKRHCQKICKVWWRS